MEFDDLKVFIEVVEAGGITRAAQRLGLAKSMVSRCIARIEVELATQLITRTPKGIGITDGAREFAERGRHILAEMAEAKRLVAGHSNAVAGTIRIAMPLSFGLRKMAPVLAALRRTYPHLQIDASYGDSAVDLLTGRYDAAIRIGNLKASTLVARRIAPVSKILVASPAYLERSGTPRTPLELQNHDCIIYTGLPERPTWLFGGAKGQFVVIPSGHFSTDNGEAGLQATEAGFGIAELPDFLAEDGLRSGRLIQILQDYPMEGGALYVVRPPAKTAPAKVRTLIELMLSEFGARRT